jgi:hypothetical protein
MTVLLGGSIFNQQTRIRQPATFSIITWGLLQLK